MAVNKKSKVTNSGLRTLAGEWKRDAARGRGERLLRHLGDTVAWGEVCGSVRRGKEWVKDVELVVVPADVRSLLGKLDGMVRHKMNPFGPIGKAMYGEPGRQTERWGDKYRGLYWHDDPEADGDPLKIEVFLADENNRGYIQWLRTGPGDANHEIMARCPWGPGVKFEDGYGWWHDGREWRRLRIADEAAIFDVMGLPYLAPGSRTIQVYRDLLRVERSGASVARLRRMLADDGPEAPTQLGLF